MENKTYVELQVADGTTMYAYVSLPENSSEKSPAIIVIQEAYGVNAHMKRVTDKFASEGYIAICPELFHRTAPKGYEGDYRDFNSVMPHFSKVTVENLEADLKACYEWLTGQPETDQERIFSVGYCLGGYASFVANTTLPLRAAISYYGGRTHTLLDRVDRLSGKHLFFWGGLDKHILKEHVDAVTAALDNAGKPYVNVIFSDAEHAFNSDDRPSFNENASKEAWALTLEFLKDA